MARRYYRSRVRYIRPKKKWATNIKSDFVSLPESSGLIFGYASELVANSSQSNTPTPVIVKCGNFKCSVDLVASMTVSSGTISFPALTAYIMFVPQGVLPSILSGATSSQINGLIEEHPEYIMGWRQLDTFLQATSGSANAQTVTFSSRMKRNLNSGDRVCLIIRAVNTVSVTLTLRGSYNCQFWTCAN